MQHCGRWKLICHCKLMVTIKQRFYWGVLPLWTLHANRGAVSITVPQRFDAHVTARLMPGRPPPPGLCGVPSTECSLSTAPESSQHWDLPLNIPLTMDWMLITLFRLKSISCDRAAETNEYQISICLFSHLQMEVYFVLNQRWDEFMPLTVTHCFLLLRSLAICRASPVQ